MCLSAVTALGLSAGEVPLELGEQRLGEESRELCRFPLPSAAFTGFPHINGSLELVLKSDNVPNDRIRLEIK